MIARNDAHCPRGLFEGDSPIEDNTVPTGRTILGKRSGPFTRGPIPDASPKEIKKIAFVTCFFNPVGYQKPIENFHRFKNDLLETHEIDLFTIELDQGRGFSVPEDRFTKRIEADPERSTLWQKERLLNILIEEIPDEYDAIAWVDADLLFLRADLADSIRDLLSRRNWGQPFSGSWYADKRGVLERGKTSTGWFYTHEQEKTLQFTKSHPGFAWVARRDWLQSIGGLYQYNITGGGDVTMLQGVNAGAGYNSEDGFGVWRGAVEKWAESARENGGSSFGYVGGDVVHLYHGSRKNRRYVERFEYLIRYGFDPETDIEIDDRSGVLLWSDYAIRNKNELVETVRDYFSLRQEDE
jgi:hypothetical protein